MSIGMILLTATAILVFFGVTQRVLDKLHLTDRAALVLIALMFFGTLIPNIMIGNVSISIGGTVIGCLIISLLNNMMNLMNVQSYWQLIVKGIVIMLAVGVDMSKKQNKD